MVSHQPVLDLGSGKGSLTLVSMLLALSRVHQVKWAMCVQIACIKAGTATVCMVLYSQGPNRQVTLLSDLNKKSSM